MQKKKVLKCVQTQSMRRPKLFWVSAGAPLASVILSTLLVFAFKAQNHGISVVSSATHDSSFLTSSPDIISLYSWHCGIPYLV